LKIKVRDKIVADGIADPAFDMRRKGKYLDAAQFNRLTDDPATIVVDMRNHYEYEVGHFDKAIEVPSDTFREQLPMSAELLKDKKENPIIMYWTGWESGSAGRSSLLVINAADPPIRIPIAVMKAVTCCSSSVRNVPSTMKAAVVLIAKQLSTCPLRSGICCGKGSKKARIPSINRGPDQGREAIRRKIKIVFRTFS